jgi:hypothetical protein
MKRSSYGRLEKGYLTTSRFRAEVHVWSISELVSLLLPGTCYVWYKYIRGYLNHVLLLALAAEMIYQVLPRYPCSRA